MENRYFKKARAFSVKDIMNQYGEIKSIFSDVDYSHNKGKFEIFIKLKPTEESLQYKVKLVTKVGRSSVKVFVVEPNISKLIREKKGTNIPHKYPDGSLCLFLPEKKEWSYYDSWAKTLIPWTCLWLYYYEVWLLTGEWLGGGVHPSGDNKGID